MRYKIIIIFSLLVVFLFSSFPVFAQVISDEKAKIVWGYCPYGMLETGVMKGKQFWKKYLPNVEVEWFFGLYSPHLVNNWIAGKLELAYLGNMPAIALQSNKMDTKWVGIAVYPHGEVAAIFVPNNSKIQSVKELNGKSVATGVGSSHHRILEEIMKQEGIKFDIVNQAPEVAIGNLEAGKLEAFCYWPPYLELVKYKKIARALPPGHCKKYEPYINAIWPIVVSERFAKAHPKIVKGLVKADMDLHKFMMTNLDEASQIVFKELEEKIPLPVVKASLASYQYADRFDQEHIEVMQRDIDFLYSKGFIKRHFKAADWADTSFVKEILSEKK
jgi:ABC-type nitrate/sulfonate/bicarbonate transport system substrate-binding protein